jgi:hypothetical protein
MPSKNTPDQPEQPDRPDRVDAADAEAPTQRVPVDAPTPAAPSGESPAETPAPPAATAADTSAPLAATPRNRFAWVSSPRVAAATVITAIALGALGGAFALGRATAGHDHGDRGSMVQMGVPGGPGGPGFDGRGFGHDRFGTQMMPGQRGQEDQQQAPSAPTPSASANG